MTKKYQKTGLRYPDARLKGIRQYFELHRSESNWRPATISPSTIATLRIAPSKEGEVVRALRFLHIIDEQGHPTEVFDALRGEFSQVLESLIKQSYNELFSTIPISRITQDTLVSFFMQAGYSKDTAEYQGMLFVGLCNDAGIALPNVKESFSRSRFEGKSVAKKTKRITPNK